MVDFGMSVRTNFFTIRLVGKYVLLVLLVAIELKFVAYNVANRPVYSLGDSIKVSSVLRSYCYSLYYLFIILVFMYRKSILAGRCR
jgi:hypothetical protein